MTDRRPRDGALSQFTVLELTVARAGPFAGRQLADWGADVIKIEQPHDPDNPHGRGSMGARHGSDFQNLHRNRRSLTIDLKNPAGIATLTRLAERADVLIENFRPDVKRRLGIDYDTLAKGNPRLVYASISGFGEDGPYGVRAGVDQIVVDRFGDAEADLRGNAEMPQVPRNEFLAFQIFLECSNQRGKNQTRDFREVRDFR